MLLLLLLLLGGVGLLEKTEAAMLNDRYLPTTAITFAVDLANDRGNHASVTGQPCLQQRRVLQWVSCDTVLV